MYPIEKYGWNDIWHDEEKTVYSKSHSLDADMIIFYKANDKCIKIKQIDYLSNYSLEKLKAIYETAKQIKEK